MNIQLTAISDKKFAIFESTLRLIKEFGFHGVPMSRIAQDAGVATGTIYHYFVSKDELIIELFKYSKQKAHKTTFENDDIERPYPERFVNIWMNLVKYYTQHPEVMSFFDQFYSSPFVKNVFSKETMCFQDDISRFLQQGIDKGYIKSLDFNIVSAAYLGTIVATVKRILNGYFPMDEESMKNMVGIIWDGIKQ